VTLGELARGRLSLAVVAAVQAEGSEALAVPLLSALYLVVRHAAMPHAPHASTLSHTTDYKGTFSTLIIYSSSHETKRFVHHYFSHAAFEQQFN
jgi:hypothetical protein